MKARPACLRVVWTAAWFLVPARCARVRAAGTLVYRRDPSRTTERSVHVHAAASTSAVLVQLGLTCHGRLWRAGSSGHIRGQARRRLTASLPQRSERRSLRALGTLDEVGRRSKRGQHPGRQATPI